MRTIQKTSYILEKEDLKLIKAEMIERELTLRQLAKQLGISAAYLCDIFKGKRALSSNIYSGLVRLGFIDRVNGDTMGCYDGLVRIIWGDKAKKIIITAMGTEDDKLISLNDCLKLIGYKKGGYPVVLVMIETFTSGDIYEYGNYGQYWTKYGSTRGFA